MVPQIKVVLIVAVTVTCIGGQCAKGAPAKLSTAEDSLVRQVAALYRFGRFADVRARLAPAIERWNEGQKAAVNQLLEQIDSPSVNELISRSLLQTMRDDPPRKLGARESWAVLQQLGARPRDAMGDPSKSPAAVTELPASFLQYELSLRHIVDQQTHLAEDINGARLCVIAANSLRTKRLKPTDDQKRSLTTDYEQRISKLQQQLDALRVQALTLRVHRVLDAQMVIRLSKDTAERLSAALVLRQDAQPLVAELETLKRLENEILAAEAARLSLLVEPKHELDAELAAKARLLDTAIAWWIRGRYGLGPLARGLLKPPGNPRHPATHGFVMLPPLAGPNASQPPRFRRRHPFVWGAKRREIETVDGRRVAGATDVQRTRHLTNYEFRHLDLLVGDPFADARTGPAGAGASQRAARTGAMAPHYRWSAHLNYLISHDGKLTPHVDPRVPFAERAAALENGKVKFAEVTTFEAWPYPRRPPPEDKFMVENFTFEDHTTYRPIEKHTSHGRVTSDMEDMYLWVGFVEYANALRRFDELLKRLSPEELAAVEEIVSADPRLAVASNLSGELAGQPTSPRRGLVWVLALARLEVGAVLAAYTEHPTPFAAVNPTQYEFVAYQELLQDAMHMHVEMLPKDIRWDMAPKADSRDLLQLHRHLTLTARLIAASWGLAAENDRPPLQYLANNLTSTIMPLEQHLQHRMRTTTSYTVGDERTDKSKVYGSRTTAPTAPSFKARVRRQSAERIEQLRSE